MREQFTFYKSFDDVYFDLSDKQKLDFMETILNVQFLRTRIEDVVFQDKILNIVWKSIKHSLSKSISGYLDSQKKANAKDPYFGVYDTLPKGVDEDLQMGVSEQGKGKEEEKEKEEVKGKESKAFSFNLTKKSQYSSLSKSYQDKLYGYAVVKDGAYQFQKFIDHNEANGGTFKDWSKGYNTWVSKSIEFSKGSYSPDTYKKVMTNHPDYEAVYVPYGQNKVFSEEYDYICDFDVKEQSKVVTGNEPEYNPNRDITNKISKLDGWK